MDKFPALSLLPGSIAITRSARPPAIFSASLAWSVRRMWPTTKTFTAARPDRPRRIEALCEKNPPRAREGESKRSRDRTKYSQTVEPVPGKDVSFPSILNCNRNIENAFLLERNYKGELRSNQHGAAVIIKVDTGEVLAMVSNPGFDPNTLSAKLHELVLDESEFAAAESCDGNGGGTGIDGEGDCRSGRLPMG